MSNTITPTVFYRRERFQSSFLETLAGQQRFHPCGGRGHARGNSFKPNPRDMSFGELMIHIAHSNSEAFARVAGTKELTPPAGDDKQTALRFLADSFDQCAQNIAVTTPEQFDKMFDIPEGRQPLGWKCSGGIHR
jgi:hypothetical protein